MKESIFEDVTFQYMGGNEIHVRVTNSGSFPAIRFIQGKDLYNKGFEKGGTKFIDMDYIGSSIASILTTFAKADYLGKNTYVTMMDAYKPIIRRHLGYQHILDKIATMKSTDGWL